MTLNLLPQPVLQRFQHWLDQRSQLSGDWRSQEWLALDIESNGLSCGPEGILSIAWVPLSEGSMQLAQAEYHVVRADTQLNQSVIHHELTQSDLAEGEPLEAILHRLAEVLVGRIMVAHHAKLDWGLLSAASQWLDIPLQPLAIVDTLMLERRSAQGRYRQEQMGGDVTGAFTLPACRARHGLPARIGHHALEDAIACGELFLAQAWKLANGKPLSAQELVNRSRP
jgi:DNA polymerase-3 subunit epsilon